MRAAAIFQGTDGYMHISSNGGATWTKETAAGKREWSSIVFSGDGKRLAAGVDGGYIRTRSF